MPDKSKPCPEACRLLDRLHLQATDVHRLTEGLHENHLAKRVLTDRWSLKELVCHIRRVQQVFVQDRLELMLAQDNPQLVAYAPESDPRFPEMVEQPTDETITAYLEERKRLIDRLAALTPDAWHRPARHPTYPKSDVCSLAEYLVHHEAHHIYQMFQRRALLGPLAS
jgi:hypothetical protein